MCTYGSSTLKMYLSTRHHCYAVRTSWRVLASVISLVRVEGNSHFCDCTSLCSSSSVTVVYTYNTIIQTNLSVNNTRLQGASCRRGLHEEFRPFAKFSTPRFTSSSPRVLLSPHLCVTLLSGIKCINPAFFT